MVVRNQRPKKRSQSSVELAVAAFEPNSNPLDVDMSGVGTDPTDLGLDDGTEVAACPHRRYVCARCGRPLRQG
jgi:hypothetical protein